MRLINTYIPSMKDGAIAMDETTLIIYNASDQIFLKIEGNVRDYEWIRQEYHQRHTENFMPSREVRKEKRES